MADTLNYLWTKPAVTASVDTWGTILNTAFDDIDADLKLVSDSVDARLEAAQNLADLADVSVARTNLGLVIGTNVQAQNAKLNSLATKTFTAGRGLLMVSATEVGEFVLTDAAKALLDDASVAAMRTTLGLGTAATVNTGTSGATIPLLNAANTWDLKQTFAIVPSAAGNQMMRVATGTSTNSGRVSFGTAAPGTLAIGEIYLQYDS